MYYHVLPETNCQGLFNQVHKIFTDSTRRTGGTVPRPVPAPTCGSHLLNLVPQHTLDFVAHGFGAGGAEMYAHLVSGLADFLEIVS